MELVQFCLENAPHKKYAKYRSIVLRFPLAMYEKFKNIFLPFKNSEQEKNTAPI